VQVQRTYQEESVDVRCMIRGSNFGGQGLRLLDEEAPGEAPLVLPLFRRPHRPVRDSPPLRLHRHLVFLRLLHPSLQRIECLLLLYILVYCHLSRLAGSRFSRYWIRTFVVSEVQPSQDSLDCLGTCVGPNQYILLIIPSSLAEPISEAMASQTSKERLRERRVCGRLLPRGS